MSSSPNASSTASPDLSHSRSGTALALGISLAVVSILVFGGLAFYFARRRRTQRRVKERNGDMLSHRRTYMVSVDPTDLAARVTPFGVNAPAVQVPKFVHTPGENMRVAHRRSNGGWAFDEITNQSFDLQHEETASMYSRLNMSTKEKKLRPGELTTRGYVEPDAEGCPPPAYTHEESVFSDCTGV